MIYDSAKNIAQYSALNADLESVVRAALDYAGKHFSAGHVAVDGERVYLNLASYQTHDASSAAAEAHKAYVDVMVMLDGVETVYVQHAEQLKEITQPYNSDTDALLGKLSEQATAVILRPGDFLILFPQDAHMPGCHAHEPSSVKKVIGKIRI